MFGGGNLVETRKPEIIALNIFSLYNIIVKTAGYSTIQRK